ncbi:HET-domain-containing protein [Byssothecium circinans]|uniref:HET-domain-containing protein n=1 Tax=Byssothecium circinans TaxID=147558 RepID=A0A6A5TJB8_9PLEO|nr:HET-domain-containing protein [Byssothecium circinans]
MAQQPQAPQANVAYLSSSLQTAPRRPSPYKTFVVKRQGSFGDAASSSQPDPSRLYRSSNKDSLAYPRPANNHSKSTQFTYTALPKDKSGSIRLLSFNSLPSRISPTGPFYCTISSTVPWETQSDYHCLSYCWGEGKISAYVYIKNEGEPDALYRPLPLSQNLCDALTSILQMPGVRRLWIDAISINQEDMQERSAQVAMMKEIYNRASSVIIWLGDTTTADIGHSIISHISKRFTRDTNIHSEHIIGPAGLTLSPDHLELLKWYTRQSLLDRDMMKAYKQMASFFMLPWFRRVWVLQEAFAHTAITVRIGSNSISWGSIVLAALWQSFLARDYTSKAAWDPNSAAHGTGYLPELWLGLLHNREPRDLSMTELVCRAREFQASDPRDKVFALLGLANDAPTIRPDYTKSKHSVYCAFAKTIIAQTGNLDILSAVNTFKPESRDGGASSWMPDLDFPIATIRGLSFPRKYNASYSTTASLSPSPTATTLSLTGFFIDTLTSTLSPLLTLSKDLHLYIGNSPTTITTLWTTYLQAQNLPQPQNLINLLHSFIHTLTSTGFALPTSFPAHPLGNVVPTHFIPSVISDFMAYYEQVDPSLSLLSSVTFRDEHGSTLDAEDLVRQGDADQFAVLAGKACHERRFFISERGRMGLCPREARHGDKIVVLYGGSVPVVLREVREDAWLFVGECYVDGMMFGEAEGWKAENRVQDYVFNIR